MASKSDDISLKCVDITIFKMAVIRHLEFPNFENFHIRPLLLADRHQLKLPSHFVGRGFIITYQC